MSGSKRVLMITAHWPPLLASGTMRVLGFARNLPSFGWEPTVLTVDHALSGTPSDESLMARVPAGLPVRRLPNPGPAYVSTLLTRAGLRRSSGRKLDGRLTPAAGAGQGKRARRPTEVAIDFYNRWGSMGLRALPWMATALPVALREAARADVIWTTYPHWDPVVLSLAVAAITRRPLVVDYRDPGLHPRIDPLYSPAHRALFGSIERAVTKSASALVFTSDWMADDYRRKYEKLPPTTVISNGLDLDLWGDETPPASTGPFTLFLAGTIRARDELGALLTAIDTLDGEGTIRPGDFRLQVLSGQAGWLDEAATGRPCRQYLELRGLVPQAEATALAGRATVCLATQEEEYAACVPAKVFQYLVHRRPLLTLCDRGATADVTAQYRLGLVAPLTDAAAIALALRRFVEAWRVGTLGDLYDPEARQHFDRVPLTRALAGVLDGVRR